PHPNLNMNRLTLLEFQTPLRILEANQTAKSILKSTQTTQYQHTTATRHENSTVKPTQETTTYLQW
ncbi:32241_t:CDS:1, partial [Gigaspora margarita]